MSPLTDREREVAAERRSKMVIALVTVLLASIPPTVMAFAAWNATRETHSLVNSRFDEYKLLLKEQSDARDKERDKEKK